MMLSLWEAGVIPVVGSCKSRFRNGVAVYSEEEQASEVNRVFNSGLPGSAGTCLALTLSSEPSGN